MKLIFGRYVCGVVDIKHGIDDHRQEPTVSGRCQSVDEGLDETGW